MQFIKKLELKQQLRRKPVQIGLLILVAIILLSIFTGKDSEDVAKTAQQKSTVTTITAAEFVGSNSLSLIGNVRASSEVVITSERAGRVTSVRVKLGQQVNAGTILATLENASESASVLQAEGVYDAAVAARAQSGVGVDEAKNSQTKARNEAVSTFKSSYNTVNGAIINSIDQFFSNPESRLPGLRIDGRGYTTMLNNERVAFEQILSDWKNSVNTVSVDSNLETELTTAKVNVQRTINFVDIFITIFNQQHNNGRYSDSELLGFSNSFTALRATLLGVQSNLNGAITELSTASDKLRRAELSAGGGVNSVADAQVKQALGSLRAAQANYAKTILRTPIAGTVNSLPIYVGDFINSFSQVAIVANNNGLEIVTYLSESERAMLAVGDEVVIEGVHTGLVSQISPAIDKDTKKIEVRIMATGIDVANGDTVRITKDTIPNETISKTVTIPLSAVKFELKDGYVYLVEDNRLVARPVTLGVVRGGSVEIVSGLNSDESFVLDARGLLAGEEVIVTK